MGKQVAVEPRDATVSTYVESLSHKVCVAHIFSLSFFVSHHEATAPAARIDAPTFSPAHPARVVLPVSQPR